MRRASSHRNARRHTILEVEILLRSEWRALVTEEEWLTTESVGAMLHFLRYSKLGPDEGQRARKYRLFAVACARRIWGSLTEVDRQAVVLAERWADGLSGKAASNDELKVARGSGTTGIARKTLLRSARMAATDSAISLNRGFPTHNLLRDVFGNPFRPVDFYSIWRTEAAVGIAAKMYEDREFGNMPVLADALEEAGCDQKEVLDHCRVTGVHVRGCWVVELLLGKS